MDIVGEIVFQFDQVDLVIMDGQVCDQGYCQYVVQVNVGVEVELECLLVDVVGVYFVDCLGIENVFWYCQQCEGEQVGDEYFQFVGLFVQVGKMIVGIGVCIGYVGGIVRVECVVYRWIVYVVWWSIWGLLLYLVRFGYDDVGLGLVLYCCL